MPLLANRTKWVGVLALSKILPTPIPTVLMYHSVNRTGTDFFNVTPERFDRQLRDLAARGRRFVRMDEVTDYVEGRTRISGDALCLTFDDGYRDNLLEALPILERYGAHAAIYFTTGFVEKGTNKGLPVCSKEEVRRLAAHPLITIGSHTRSHPELDKLDGHAAWNEIHGGKSTLEDWIGREVRHFAYPKGKYNGEIVRMVEKAGFASAVTVRPGAVDPGQGRFLINRVPVDEGMPSWALVPSCTKAYAWFLKKRVAVEW